MTLNRVSSTAILALSQILIPKNKESQQELTISSLESRRAPSLMVHSSQLTTMSRNTIWKSSRDLRSLARNIRKMSTTATNLITTTPSSRTNLSPYAISRSFTEYSSRLVLVILSNSGVVNIYTLSALLRVLHK